MPALRDVDAHGSRCIWTAKECADLLLNLRVIQQAQKRAARASKGSSPGVCPDVTMCRGPRTDAAGLTGTTWPVTSQSNRWRIAASRYLTLGAASSRMRRPRSRSPRAPAGRRRSTARWRPRTRRGIPQQLGHRRGAILAAKNSRKRMLARSPAAPTRAGSIVEVIETSWFTRPPPLLRVAYLLVRRSTATCHTRAFALPRRRRTSFHHSSRAARAAG
jgi:hypothetical protein